jgi:hypothetical protein
MIAPFRTEIFPLAPRERYFYDQWSDYLREGYTAAQLRDCVAHINARLQRGEVVP